jgi:predicted Rdx family selenoprotein
MHPAFVDWMVQQLLRFFVTILAQVIIAGAIGTLIVEITPKKVLILTF